MSIFVADSLDTWKVPWPKRNGRSKFSLMNGKWLERPTFLDTNRLSSAREPKFIDT